MQRGILLFLLILLVLILGIFLKYLSSSSWFLFIFLSELLISASLFSPVCRSLLSFSKLLCSMFLAIAGSGDAVDFWDVAFSVWEVASNFRDVASDFWEVAFNVWDASKSNVWNVGANMDVVSIGLSRDIGMPKDEHTKINTRFIVIIIFS